MLNTLIKIPFTALLILLSSCSAMHPVFDEPEVNVTAFKLLPSSGLPKFEIKLQITNPNSIDLNLRGLSYSASIEGNKVLTGAANQLPQIPAYGEGEVTLNGAIDLLGGFQLINDLMQKQTKGLGYTLNIKMDVGLYLPAIRIEKQGQVLPPRR